MDEILINREVKICWKCNYRVKTAENRCPRCMKELKTEFEIQKKAIYNLLAGLFFTLVGFFVFAKYNLFSMGSVRNSDLSTQMIGLLDFGLMMSWGMPMTVCGIWQYLTGKNGETIGTLLSRIGLALTCVAAVCLLFFFR